MLKKILIGAALAAALASPALAQSFQPEWGSGNIVANNGSQQANAPVVSRTRAPFWSAFAFEPPATAHRHLGRDWRRD